MDSQIPDPSRRLLVGGVAGGLLAAAVRPVAAQQDVDKSTHPPTAGTPPDPVTEYP